MDHERVRRALDSLFVERSGTAHVTLSVAVEGVQHVQRVPQTAQVTLRVPAGDAGGELVFIVWLSEDGTLHHAVVDVHGSNGKFYYSGFVAPGIPSACPIYKHQGPLEFTE